jgi:hypothetical protein
VLLLGGTGRVALTHMSQSFRLSSIAARRALLLERGFRQIVAALNDIIVVTDADGSVAWTNELDVSQSTTMSTPS